MNNGGLSCALPVATSVLALLLATQIASAQTCGSEVVLRYLDAGTSSPLLRTPRGAPVVGGDFAFRVEGGMPLEVGFLIFNSTESPFFDPTFQATLYPQVPALVRLFFTNAAGSSPLLFDTPEIFDDLCGEQATFQAGVADPGAPGGFAITNAVRIRVGSVTEPLFEPVSEMGGNASGVALGDLNSDGLADLVTANSDGASAAGFVQVRLGARTGGFGAPATLSTGGIDSSSVELADVSGEGDLDALVTNRGSDTVSVLLGDGNGAFFGSASFAAANGPAASAVADLDLDGLLDVVVANGNDSVASVLLGAGGGVLGFATQFFAGAGTGGSGPGDVELGDLDLDGDFDMVLAVSFGNLVSILLGNGNGTFGAPSTLATTGFPLSLVLEDLDGDTQLDAAVACLFSNDVSVRMGNGNGMFGAETRFAVGSAPRSLAGADLDGDLLIDLVAANSKSDDVSVLHNGGGGSFTADHVGAFRGPYAVGVADTDSDGALDVVAAGPHIAFTPGAGITATLLGNGDGTFRGHYSYALGFSLREVASADFDDDGWNDLVAAGNATSQLVVLLGNGGGAFGLPVAYPTGTIPGTVITVDLDGDAIEDILLASSSQLLALFGNGNGSFGAVTVLGALSNNSRAAVADLDGDFVPDVVTASSTTDDVSVFLGNGDGTFGAPTSFAAGDARDVVLADLDGDTFLDVVFPTVFPVAVRVMLGNGDGSFDPPSTQPMLASQLMLADFDEDGDVDLVTSHLAAITRYLGNGNGTFGSGTVIGSGTPVSNGTLLMRLAASDLNEDGNLDVVALDWGSGDLVVVPGNGDGSFGAQVAYHAAFTPDDVALGDLDGDGVLDAAVSDRNAVGRIRVLRNQVGE